MPITVVCRSPACKEVFDVRDSFAGLHVRCPACGTPVAVSTPAAQAPRSLPPPLPRAGRKRRAIEPLVLPVDADDVRSAPAPAPARRSRLRGRFARAGRKRAVHRGPKERHGCVTAWLILIIVGNLAGIVLTMYLEGQLASMQADVPAVVFLIPLALFAGVIVCAVALLNWKKWGFYGIALLVAISTALHVVGGSKPLQVAMGPISLIVLYLVLQMGNKRSAWSQLE